MSIQLQRGRILWVILWTLTGVFRIEAQSTNPSIAIELLSNAQVRLTWPGTASFFRLEQTDSLRSGTVWNPVSQTPAPLGQLLSVTVGTPVSARYFRLTLDGSADTDGDRLSTAWELQYGYDPGLADSDGNGIRDDMEDPDGDGVINYDEARLGTNPRNGDTDGDGYDDNGEILEGSDPTSAASVPRVLVASTTVSFLNAVPETTAAGTQLNVVSLSTSFLNAMPETVPTGTSIAVASLVGSYLNATADTITTGTPISLASSIASYLNAAPESPSPGTQLNPVSSVVSYQNQ